MTNVTPGQGMTWLQSHLWTMNIVQNARIKNRKKNFIIKFRAIVTAVCSISHQDGNWYKPQFHCDHCKNVTCLRRELKSHKKNFISISKSMYPLYDRCHARAENNMTPISLMITETRILFKFQALGITRKTSLSNSELWWPPHFQCHIKMEVDINPSFIVITATTELVRDASSIITRKTLSAFRSQLSAVWQMSRQGRPWHYSNLTYNY